MVENKGLSLEILRGRNPPSPARHTDSPSLVPPPRKSTPRETAAAAAASAINGYVRALEEEDPKMVAARTAQAIAVAASTSRTRAGYVAAATAVESIALLHVEDCRIRAQHGQVGMRTKHAINVAVDAALAANDYSTAAPPPTFDVRDADLHTLEGSQLPPLSRRPRGQMRVPEWQIWKDFIGGIALAFEFGYLIPFAYGSGAERAFLSGTAVAAFFGFILFRAGFFNDWEE
ncbi:hypothetical protein KVR01_005666 [Diaporthe batatas]|uniref:uncharacterized protein n=1 Tax=Diaporthe batatas TaxID=748121 RepID=UPI001D040DCE|nr:uncharacterized protein KVR01_005666 [Diaporthe batatas]KAG8165391.1 hypothetical protein KVR01_005666 [Diaporthe batatas]